MRRLNARSEARRPGRLRLWLRRSRRFAKPAALGAIALVAFAAGAIAWRSGLPGQLAEMVRERIIAATASGGLVVARVTVEGRTHADAAEILAASGLAQGQPMLDVSPEAIRARLEALPWVEQAAVQRRFPGHVHLVIAERTPFAIWQNRGRFALIDRQGRVIVRDAVERFAALPLVVGEGAANEAATLLGVLAMYPEVQRRVTAAVRVNQRRWNLRLASGADVLLPEGHEAAALERLIALHQENQVLDRQLIAVDLRLPDRMVLRPVPGEQPEPRQTAPERRTRG
ncbi:cell division protein FtsQ/DivIB [Elioraea tepidiphila]|uniref:cell division protein FtsQ/DivIB n=1 Tax=Elioraea tepidiphila TaxID=457934 RepID=UPI000375FA28|nr:cell division protein FtsQ/DivIB [Elioraea tepidiphila]